MAAETRPFAVAAIDHLVLRCAQPEVTLSFYTEVLGLSEERRVERLGLVQLRAGASMVDLISLKEPAPGRNLEHFCLALDIADFDSLVRYLRRREVEIVGEPGTRYGARGSGLSVYIRDPEGNLVELKQNPPG